MRPCAPLAIARQLRCPATPTVRTQCTENEVPGWAELAHTEKGVNRLQKLRVRACARPGYPRKGSKSAAISTRAHERTSARALGDGAPCDNVFSATTRSRPRATTYSARQRSHGPVRECHRRGLVNNLRRGHRKAIGTPLPGDTLRRIVLMVRLASSWFCCARVTRRSWSIRSRRAELMRRATIAAVTCVVLPLSLACGSAVGRGTSLYQQQNYIEAAEAFERTQGRLATMQPDERARYGLYRGLTFMALGDWKGAERWLDYSEALQRTQPNLLPADERQLLARGRREKMARRHAWLRPRLLATAVRSRASKAVLNCAL
jgi:tetratricopeptide (TPR) repeat protein